MKWTSTIATETVLDAAVEQAAEQVFRGLGGQEPDLLLAFVSSRHAADYPALASRLSREFESAFVFGCCANGVIGGGQEIEDRPALSLTAGVLPGVRFASTHLELTQIPPVFAERRFWEDAFKVTAEENPAFLLLADPFSFDTDGFLQGLDRAFPASVKIGGFASGAQQPGGTALYLGGKVHHTGLIALALTGDIEITTSLSQGCRPIGDPMFVTSAHDNLILKLDGRVPREILGDIFEGLSPADRRLYAEALFIGLGTPGEYNQYRRVGDFLVRSILGLDPQSGALWVASRVPANSVVQLHVRDPLSAAQDIEHTLHRHKLAAGSKVTAAVLFSCLSRGSRFYGQADHDSDAFRRIVADVPLGGFFCGGEIGQVRGTTYLHGHTSVFGTFAPKGSKHDK